MPSPIPNRFTSYDFSEEEFKSASIFNPLQKMFIQTEVAKIATQMLNLDCATQEQIAEFEIQRAFLKGQIIALEHLLAISASQELDISEEESQKSYVVDVPQSPNLYTHFLDQSQDPNKEQ